MPNIGIQDSFNNVKIVCDKSCEPGMDNVERQAVNESLHNISVALQEGLELKAKVELLEKQLNETDKKTEETPEDES